MAVASPAVWTTGIAFSVPLLFILGIHELGHVVACRHHRLPATLPYFIPAPVGIGTFGAVIRINAPITDTTALFDVGASGPLVGFAVTIPILIWGLASSHVVAAAPGGTTLVFGEPLLFQWVEHAFFPATRTGADLSLSPAAFAAWFGLFVTALNLLPLSQLDGGHILYATLGKWQKPAARVLFVVLLILGFFWPGWFLWALIVLILGIAHPSTTDEHQPLGRGRRVLAVICLAVFLVCFTPVPLKIVNSPPATKVHAAQVI